MMNMMKKGPIISKQTCLKWIKALRSGKFKQQRNKLKNSNQHGTRYCCLGVLNEISGYPIVQANQELVTGPSLPGNIMCTLIKFNDEKEYHFNRIASHIERHILPRCPDKKVDKKVVF